MLFQVADEAKDGPMKKASQDDQEEEESKALFSDLSDLTSASTSRRQLDAGTLDAKVVKALKRQEEKREKRNARKKEVSYLERSKHFHPTIVQTLQIFRKLLMKYCCVSRPLSGKNCNIRSHEKEKKTQSWLKRSKSPEKISDGTLEK